MMILPLLVPFLNLQQVTQNEIDLVSSIYEYLSGQSRLLCSEKLLAMKVLTKMSKFLAMKPLLGNEFLE